MKRIISTILVVCMLALALVGCGYSLADDKMTNYATFSSDKFEELLKKILIEDGDFTTDPATREAKVLENIYSAIASAVKTDAEKEKEGTPGERDVVYYSYYATAVFEEVTAYFYADKMKSGSPASIQLRPGNDFGKDELSAKIAALVATHDFSNFAYSSVSSGKVEEGDVPSPRPSAPKLPLFTPTTRLLSARLPRVMQRQLPLSPTFRASRLLQALTSLR